jgi:hypothetical protein
VNQRERKKHDKERADGLHPSSRKNGCGVLLDEAKQLGRAGVQRRAVVDGKGTAEQKNTGNAGDSAERPKAARTQSIVVQFSSYK